MTEPECHCFSILLLIWKLTVDLPSNTMRFQWGISQGKSKLILHLQISSTTLFGNTAEAHAQRF